MTQIYHRYLDLPFTVSKPNEFIDKDHNEQLFFNNDIVPIQLKEFLNNIDLQSIHTEAFYTAPKDKIYIHCDTPELDNHVKINFTWGSNDSVTRWWKIKQDKEMSLSNVEDGGGILTAHENDCDLVYEQVIDKPSLMNVGVLHSTYNPSSEGRWTLSLVLSRKNKTELLLWGDAVKIFKDYIL